jgi:5-methyltetrahydropteroyltriglutamate--homocysteine methyltransferase
MKRSVDRILTSHAGSLPRPPELRQLFARKASAAEVQDALDAAVKDVIRRQREAGIDIVNDGEYGKPMSADVDYGAFLTYVYDRLSGYESREVEADVWVGNKDFQEFPDFYRTGEAGALDPRVPTRLSVCVGPVEYTGHDQVQRDISDLRRGLNGSGAEEAFITAVSSGAAIFVPGDHYASVEDEAIAVAEAMREEYKAITDAGFIVQLDNPHLVDHFTFTYSVDWDVKKFRKWAQHHVELVNYSLEGIPEEQVRYHVCWGSWKGPHISDLPLKDVVDLVIKVNAQVYAVEASNPRHEHEWRVWADVKLPEGRSVMPGVVTHKTNVVEHPEVVADRIMRYAEVVGRENVIAGTDCGMGGRIHPEIAWAKLKALSEGAALASARLWGGPSR